MGAKGKQQRRKRRNHKGEGRTQKKETTPKYRPNLLVGNPFDDISQPTHRQIWFDRLKRLAKWLGGLVATTAIGKLLKKLFDLWLKSYFDLD